MKSYLIIVGLFILQGCQIQYQDGVTTISSHPRTGTREFNISVNLNSVEVKVFGVFMGTSDWYPVRDQLYAFQDSGDIVNLRELSRGTEGGATYCFDFAPDADRDKVLKTLGDFPTDEKETDYSVKSLTSCPRT